MDFNATIDIIIKDLKEIREIVDDLRKYPDVPQLQIELAKSKCRSAEEIISLLKEYKPERKEEIEPVPVSKPATEKAPLIELADEVPQVSEVIESEPVPVIPSKDKHEDISEQFRSRSGSGLADYIGLNDKFLFIRGIFGGNAAAYEEALSKLSKAESLPDAKAIIMSYTGEAEETEEVTMLLEIVKRKLPANG